jgi:hypothetical protein
MNDETVKAMAERVVSEYEGVCSRELTEDKCRAGCVIMMEFVRDHLEERVPGIKERGVKLRVVTGCRPSKFSIHVVEEQLFFDSNVALLLPIFVFFLCRIFACYNLTAVVEGLMNLPEGGEVGSDLRFQLRALRLEKTVIISEFVRSGCSMDYVDGVAVERVRPEGDKDFVFSGFNDTPIDK